MKGKIKKQSKNYQYPLIELEDEFIEVNGKKQKAQIPCRWPKFYVKDIGRELEGEIITIPKFIILYKSDEFGNINIFNEKLLTTIEINSCEEYKSYYGELKVFFPK